MEVAARTATADVVPEVLRERAHHYDFFQLVELLFRVRGEIPERRVDTRPVVQGLRFSVSPSLGFPGSDVVHLRYCEQRGYGLEVGFMGLHGAQSPLPGYYLEQVAQARAHDEGAAADLLDFFHHRLLTLFHYSWRKYRHHVRYEDGARDGFSAVLFALTGLADEAMRGETPINWSKMLAYAGLVAGRSRAPEVVAGILAHYFDLNQVTILPWCARSVRIPADQRSRCGVAGMRLNGDFTVGEKVRDVNGKFVIRIAGLSRARMSEFLPSGREFRVLQSLVDFLLREPLAYDLELELQPEEVDGMRLSCPKTSQLGWTSFLSPRTEAMRQGRRVRIQTRE